jgi:predicted HicB family RNase H-like nuclease
VPNGIPSLQADNEERVLDYRTASDVLEDRWKNSDARPSTLLPRQAHQKAKIVTTAARKARQAEADAARIEKSTRNLVEGQHLWFRETRDVKPFQPANIVRSIHAPMKQQSTYPLRLPHSVKAEVERRAKADGISINQFVATAVAEKLAAMNTASFFAERRDRADFRAFDRLMRRRGGEAPRPDDLVPKD